MYTFVITIGLMGKNPFIYTINCLESSCQFTLIAKILIANCPIARILIAKSTIAQILIAKSNNCPNTDCRNTDCRNKDCLNTGESQNAIDWPIFIQIQNLTLPELELEGFQSCIEFLVFLTMTMDSRENQKCVF